MDLLGPSPLLANVAAKAKMSIAEANRVAMRFALKVCSEGGVSACVTHFPRIRTIAQAFMSGSRKSRAQAGAQYLPYTLSNVLEIWRLLWMSRRRRGGRKGKRKGGKCEGGRGRRKE